MTDDEMARVFNLGVGMVMMVDSESAGDALDALHAAGAEAAVVGRVDEGRRGVEFTGAPFWPAAPAGSDRPVPPG